VFLMVPVSSGHLTIKNQEGDIVCGIYVAMTYWVWLSPQYLPTPLCQTGFKSPEAVLNKRISFVENQSFPV
ncbi:MAG: hypothetical protein ABI415_02520, partial [Flavitalea sp.]